MADTKPPVIETAVIAWGDAFRAIGAMPVVAGIAFVFILVTSLASFAIIRNPHALVDSPWLFAVSIASSFVQAVLLAPLAIAVHRFVLLGESTNRYPLEPGSSRYLRFVGFVILVKILWLIPSAILSLIPGSQDNLTVAAGLGVVDLVLFVTVIIIVMRRAILFPAIAIDAPGATWRKAGLDTEGSSWRVAFIFALTSLPPLVIGGPLYWLLSTPRVQLSVGSSLFFSLISAVVDIPTLCAFAAAASHIYRARADVMTRPSDYTLRRWATTWQRVAAGVAILAVGAVIATIYATFFRPGPPASPYPPNVLWSIVIKPEMETTDLAITDVDVTSETDRGLFGLLGPASLVYQYHISIENRDGKPRQACSIVAEYSGPHIVRGGAILYVGRWSHGYRDDGILMFDLPKDPAFIQTFFLPPSGPPIDQLQQLDSTRVRIGCRLPTTQGSLWHNVDFSRIDRK